MRHILIIFTIFLFCLTIISCGEKEESSDDTTTTDTTAPVIAEVTAVTTPSYDTTPDYVFSSTETGTITYGGSCSSTTTSATSGNNTITFNALSDGTFSNCTITVTDSAGNVSNTLEITSFTIKWDTFVAVGDNGEIVRSIDSGSTFYDVTSPTSQGFRSVIFGNNTFVAVGESGTIARSTDNGSSWDNVTSPTANTLNGVTFKE